MPLTIHRNENDWAMQLEGELTLPSAPELKAALLDWLESGKDLQLDLERAEAIDITVMQLLWAAEREAARVGARILARAPAAAVTAVRDAGFQQFPGAAAQE